MKMTELNAKVIQRIEISPALIVLRVAPVGWEMPAFTPGQFAILALPGNSARYAMCEEEDETAEGDRLIKRAYSISSSSRLKEFLEFYVVLIPSGALTPRLFALQMGDLLWLSPRFSGMFTLKEVPPDKHLVLISTGTGLAPYMSMLRDELQCGGPRRFAVVHGARHSWELGYRSELMMLQSMCPNMTYLPLISRPQVEPVPWTGRAGRIQTVWRESPLREFWKFDPTPDNTHIFLCGNPGMIEEMTAILSEDGFREHSVRQPGQIHIEKYW
ncbi:MAG: ferredoxin--NADP(+) reductase [Planctomycetia bacterium]